MFCWEQAEVLLPRTQGLPLQIRAASANKGCLCKQQFALQTSQYKVTAAVNLAVIPNVSQSHRII